MPDKPRTDTDTDWLDAGWAEMARRLDAAMPVNDPPRRRALAWWWLATGVLLLLVVFRVWNATSPDDRLDYFPLPGTGGAQVLQTPRSEPPSTAPDRTGTVLEQENETVATRGQSAAVQPMERPGDAPLRLAVPRPEQGISTAAQPPATSLAATIDPIAAGEVAEPEVPNRSTPSSASSREPVRVTSPLPTVSYGPLTYATATLARAPRVTPLRGSWRIGTEATANAGQGWANGLGAGVVLHRSTGRRWSYDLGLRYHSWEQTWGLGSALENSRAEQDASADTTGLFTAVAVITYAVAQPGGGESRILVAQRPEDNPRIRTHWIELPLHINYRLARRWDVSMGARPALLLNSSVQLPGVTTSGSTSVFTPEPITVSNRLAQDLSGGNNGGGIVGASGKLLQRWHLGLEAGVNYRLAQRWTVGGYYRYGQDVWQSDSKLQSRTGLAGIRLVRWW